MCLTIIGSLTTSLNYIYFENSSTYFGNQDIIISKNFKDVGYDVYFNESLATEISLEVQDIKLLLPRLYITSYSSKYASQGDFPTQKMLLCGVNSRLEFAHPSLGSLWLCDEQLQKTSQIFEDEILPGHCILTKNSALNLNASKDDHIRIKVATGETILVVDEIVENDGRFAIFESALIIADLQWMQDLCQLENKINFLVGQFHLPEEIYDLTNLDATHMRINSINQQIIKNLGDNYVILEPRFLQLQDIQDITFFSSIIYDLMEIMTIVLLISAIYSILASNFSQTIHDYGLFQVLGATPRNILKFQLIQNLMHVGVSLVVGICCGFAFNSLVFQSAFFNESNLKISGITIVISLLVCLYPIILTRKWSLIQKLYPKGRITSISMSPITFGKINFKFLLLGAFILSMGEIIFVFLPRIAMSNDSMLIQQFFVLMLLIILSGFILLSISLLKYVNIGLLNITRLVKKFRYSNHHVEKWFSKKHHNRPTYTYMLLIIFAFNHFIITSQQLRISSFTTSIQYEFGSDVHILNAGSTQMEDYISADVLEQIQSMPSVERVAPIYANFPIEIESYLQSSYTNVDNILQGPISHQTYVTSISNLGQLQTIDCGLMALDQAYQSVINPSQITWMIGSNSSLDSFSDLLNKNHSCIISEASARVLGIHQKGDFLSLSLGVNEQSDITSETLQVVGIASRLPGFTNIHTNTVSLSSREAIIVSPAQYFRLIGQENMTLDPSRKIDKILLKLGENTLENRDNFVKSFNSLFQTDYSYAISDPVHKLEFFFTNEQITRNYNTLIILFSVFVNLIGIGFAFTSLLEERKHQFYILNAIGVSSKEKSRMLYQEMFIHFTSSSLLGGFIGTLLSIIIFRNIAQISEMPFLISLNYGTMGITFFGTLLFCFIALSFLIRKHKITGGHRSD
jgi:ABC-type antimicrobial peptide transport system permease subunit